MLGTSEEIKVLKRIRISVIIPVYFENNRSWRIITLQEAINSITHQIFKPIEIVIFASGNKDSLSKVEMPVGIKTIIIYEENRVDSSQARNIAVNNSCGDVLAFLDSDDLWSPYYLYHLARCYENPETNATSTYAISTKEGKVISRTSDRFYTERTKAILYRNYVNTTSAFSIRRIYFEKLHGFNGGIAPCEDLDLYVRLSLLCDIHIVPFFLVHRKIGNDNLTNDIANWFQKIALVHKKLFNSKEFRDYRKEIAIGGFSRIIRLSKKSHSINGKMHLAIIILKYSYWLFLNLSVILRKSRIESNELFQSVDNLKDQLSRHLNRGRFMFIQLDQNILNLNEPFYESTIINSLIKWLDENSIIPICVPISTSKNNDDRVPLSIIGSSFNIFYQFPIKEIENIHDIIMLSDEIMTSNIEIAKTGLMLNKYVIFIGHDKSINEFLSNCENASCFNLIEPNCCFEFFLNNLTLRLENKRSEVELTP